MGKGDIVFRGPSCSFRGLSFFLCLADLLKGGRGLIIKFLLQSLEGRSWDLEKIQLAMTVAVLLLFSMMATSPNPE